MKKKTMYSAGLKPKRSQLSEVDNSQQLADNFKEINKANIATGAQLKHRKKRKSDSLQNDTYSNLGKNESNHQEWPDITWP